MLPELFNDSSLQALLRANATFTAGFESLRRLAGERGGVLGEAR